MAALGVLGFAYAVVLLWRLGVTGEERDLALLVIGALLLAPVCSAVQLLLVRPNFHAPAAGLAETINCWAAVALLLALASVPLVMRLGGWAGDSWTQNAERIVIATAAAHGAALGLALPLRRRFAIRGPLANRAWQVTALIVALFAAGFALFWIDPSDRYLNMFVRLLFAPPFSAAPGPIGLGAACTLAVLGLAAVFALGKLESILSQKGGRALQTAAALCATVAAVVLFFDFSLTSDTFHYLTNVAPALHLLHGGTLMIDAFSQYGPGPILATALSLEIGPPTFGTAQIMVQVFNFAFYALWLVCLYRMMDRWRLAGLLLGWASIALYYASWAYGYGNVNDAPSLLGLRYLPPLLMVLALSCLRAPARHSAFTAFSTFLAALWSFETLFGTLGIHFAVLGLLALRDRAVVRLVTDAVWAVLPALAAVLAMTVGTFLRAGTLPDYGLYLHFLTQYNMLSWWAVAANPMFMGWLAMLLAVFVVLSDGWTRVLGSVQRVLDMDDTALFHRFVPMAMLAVLQGAYFTGRSVDYTLLLALLPFCAIAIPAVLAFTAAVVSARGPVRLLAIIPAVIGLWALTFTSLSLLRQNQSQLVTECPLHTRCASAPYSFILHECRDHDRCSPATLLSELRRKLHERPGLEKVGNPRGDYWYDTHGALRDALSMMAEWAADQPTVTVLIGHIFSHVAVEATEHNTSGGADSSLSDLAVMYAGKWHRWPRSFTFSDGLVVPLARRIIAAPIRLQAGELVLVREGSPLPLVEAGIWKRIREEYTLCRLSHPSKEVFAYRVAGPQGCPS